MSILRTPATDNEPATSDEAFNEELRAARRSWWSGLVSIEVGVVFAMLPIPLLLGPRDAGGGTEQYISGGSRLVDALRSIGAPTGPGYTPFDPLAVLATIGIAATVALNAAHSRFEKARERIQVKEPPSRRQVYDAQHAMSGSVGVFLVTFAALLCAHLLLVGSVIVALEPVPEEQPGPLAVSVLSGLMSGFLLVECARLLAPWRSPHQIRPKGHDRKVQNRLGFALRKAESRPLRIRRYRLLVAAILGAIIVSSCFAGGGNLVWRIGFVVTVFVVLTALISGIASSATIEVGFMRFLTVGYSVGLSASLALSFTAVLLEALLGAWPQSFAQWVSWGVVGLLWLALLALAVLRILGAAAIGPFRLYGIRFIALVGVAAPGLVRSTRSMAKYVGKVLVAELVIALPWLILAFLDVPTKRVLIGFGLLVVLGIVAVILSALLLMGKSRGVEKRGLVGAGRGSVFVSSAVTAIFLVLCMGLVVTVKWSLELGVGGVAVLVVWVASHGSQIVLTAMGTLRSRSSLHKSRRGTVVRWWLTVPRNIGTQGLSVTIHRRRHLVSRSIAADGSWSDVDVLRWWCAARNAVAVSNPTTRGDSTAASTSPGAVRP